MGIVQMNYLAILVAGIVQFAVSGLWYSPVLFARTWTSLAGVTEDQKQKANMPALFGTAFLSQLVTAYVLSNIIAINGSHTFLGGAMTGVFCWLGFAATTSHATYMFSGKPHSLWLIDSGNNLVGLLLAGGLLAIWK